jgi:hypothetical protein
MGKLLLDNIAEIGGAAIKFLILIVSGAVFLDRLKIRNGELSSRMGMIEQWRDEHVSSVQPHAACILQDRREADERERLERIERKIDRLEERIDTLMEKIHERI